MSDFIGQNPRFINADLALMDMARTQLEACIAAIQAIKERAILNPTKDRIAGLVDGITDVKSDLSHAIACAEDAATMRSAAE